MTEKDHPEPDSPESSGTGPRLGRSGFPVSRARPVELGRYSVVGVLGKGGMGIVYEAVDRERNQVVALKALRRLDPHGLRRIKAEFRAVADIVHENLVQLFELVSDADDLFFVMELVDGEGFLDHVRGRRGPRPGARRDESPRTDGVALTLPDLVARVRHASRDPDGDADDEGTTQALDAAGLVRMKTTLVQVVAGLSALHRAGKFHRDIKPTNVRVTPAGRAVVLDFGLVKDYVATDLYGPTAGTPAYMAPEQVLGERVTAATDLYAVGVMMYEALVGRKPFVGAATFVLASKVHSVPDAPRTLVPSIPEELDALCMDLLQVHPAARPSAAEVVRRLGGVLDEVPSSVTGEILPSLGLDTPASFRSPEGTTARRHTPSGSSTVPLGFAPLLDPSPESSRSPQSGLAPTALLVGRDAELEALFAGYEAACAGDTVALAVSGVSGVGKSTVVRAFLDALRASGQAVVLEGRCYERESVRFKAFDDIVDALGQVLRYMPWQARMELLPPGLVELTRIFPVLADLALPDGADKADVAPDPQELQRRAFACLKALLARVAAKKPLVLYVDDLQWGDKDSGRLLVELLSPPERPALLLVYTYRSEEAAESALLSDLAGRDFGSTIRALEVGPLSSEKSVELARTLMALTEEGRPGGLTATLADAIAEESEGSPLFVEQLVRHVAAGGSVEASLADLFSARIGSLSEEARRTLEVVAVAGRPLEQGIAERAAGLSRHDRATIPMLRAQGLVRTRGARKRDTIEASHDRVREHVTRVLSHATRRSHHLAIALALEASGRADARDLALHYHGGGDFPRAYGFAIRAAEDESRGLAFDRAADLFALALECGRAPAADLVAVRVRLAESLVSAGRSAEAAPYYLAAAERSTGDRATDLRRLAAEQLLVSGRFDEGVEVLAPVLEAVGLAFPASPRRALVAMVARIAELEVGGTDFVLRSENEVAPKDLARVDVAWSAGKGLLSVDSLRGGYFFVRAVRLALRAGEPKRVARCLAMYGMMNVYGGDARGERKGAKLLQRAHALSQKLADPVVEGTVAICRGTASMSLGAWRDGIGLMESGIEILESQAIDVGWECSTGRSSCHNARLWLGELAEIGRRAPAWSRSAERVGDLFSWVTGDLYSAIIEVCADRPREARARASQAIGRWSRSGFHFQHWLALKVMVLCDLYEGDVESAHGRLSKAWGALDESGLLRIQLMRIDAFLLRGTVAIASNQKDSRRLALATRDAAALQAEERPAAHGGAALLRAGIAAARGQRTAARTEYTIAARELARAEVRLHAACATLSCGSPEEADSARAVLTGEGIVRPERFVQMFAPAPG